MSFIWLIVTIVTKLGNGIQQWKTWSLYLHKAYILSNENNRQETNIDVYVEWQKNAMEKKWIRLEDV